MSNKRSELTEVLKQIGRKALWAPVAVLIVHWLAGGWLGHEPFVDPVMHFSGGLTAAYFFWHAASYARRYLGDLSPLGLGLLSFGLTTAAAVGWEMAEFVGDRLRGTHVQVDLANTMRDLILGIAGAVVYLGIGRWLLRARSNARRELPG